MNDTSTQSVCKHCGQLCDPNKPKYHIDYRYDGHDAEPISEPASTGEPDERPCKSCKAGKGEYHAFDCPEAQE